MPRIWVINLKKTPGSSESDTREIAEWSEQNGELVHKQIACCLPDIIICGGTWREYIHNCCKSCEAPAIGITSRGIRYAITGKTLVIDFVHLEARVPKNLLHYALLDAINEIKQSARKIV